MPAMHLTLRKLWCSGAAGVSPADGNNLQLFGTEAEFFLWTRCRVFVLRLSGVLGVLRSSMWMGAYTETMTIE